MSIDRYAKPVHVVENEVIDRTSPAVGQHNDPADQLLLGGMQFTEDVHGSAVAGARNAHVAALFLTPWVFHGPANGLFSFLLPRVLPLKN